MNFDDTPEEAQFRQQVRDWLEANAELRTAAIQSAIEGAEDHGSLPAAKRWQAKKYAAGWVGIEWPQEFGGRGLTPMHTIIYQTEEARFAVPRGYFDIGLGMCGPVMMSYATPEQVKQYLPDMMSGTKVWCQLFSEPIAGSDLAGIRTASRQEGDEWIINGQKVWTSGAHYSDYGILVTRHDPNLPKHKGLTYFFVDMHSPGIEVRPIKSIQGRSNFNEVFFKDVRVPDAQRLGGVGQGWQVAIATLMHERLAVGQATGTNFEELWGLAKQIEIDGEPAANNALLRDKLADWYVRAKGIEYGHYRMLTQISRGELPGPEASMVKVVTANQVQQIASFALDVMDTFGIINDSSLSPAEAAFRMSFLSSPAYRIAGGTDEILRNVIAERVLGLPPDIRVDKTLPYNKLPVGVS